MRTIRFYQQNGKIEDEVELTLHNLDGAVGMMTRCYMRDGSYHDGFVCFSPGDDSESMNKDYGSTFFLWTWVHLDENTHRLVGPEETKYDVNYEPIDYLQVERIDAILHSHPRWDCGLHNHFFIDTRPYLGLDDVQHLFKIIWCDGKEYYWYQTVWNILHRHNLTRYTTEREHYEVLLRAVAVSIMYEDFCMAYCDNQPSYDYLCELGDDISELALGQLYGAKFPNEITESQTDAIFALANSLRNEVVSAIKSEMNTFDIYAHLVCTVETVTVWDEDDDEMDFEVENYSDYKKAVKLFQDLPFDSPSADQLAGYVWIDDGMQLMC